MPEVDVEIGDVPELMVEEEGEKEEEVEVEEGDQIFHMALHSEDQEHIRTYSTISTQLAKAWHKQNDVPKTIPELIPQYLHDFEDVFAKGSFDSLMEHKRWDH